MPVEVHSESLRRRFLAPWASLACVLNLLILAGAFVLPVYICWATGTPSWGGLWQYESVRYEQLSLSFNNTFVVEVHGLRGAATSAYRAPFAAVYTSSAAANDLVGAEALRGMTVRASVDDANFDGTGDVFNFQATLPLSPDETVLSARAVVFMTASLSQVTRFQMDGLISAGFSSGIAGQLLSVDGDVTFAQRWPLPRAAGGVYAPYATSAIASLDAATTAEAALPLGVLAGVAGRNFSLAFTPTHAPVWVPDAAVPTADTTMLKISAEQRCFRLHITARTPPSAVRFRPSIVSELKHGWIQYVALLSISLIVAWIVRRVLFGLQIVETTVLADAPRSLAKLHVA